jgi:hypothetical protein
MTNQNAGICTRTDWNALSSTSKFLIRMFAGSPVWALTDFKKPPQRVMDELLAAAWNRSGFGEDELRANPEVVVRALRKMVSEQLRSN